MSKGKTPEVKETAAEKAAAEIALNRYNRYKEVYAPFEEKAFNDITGDASATALNRKAGGMINADSAKALDMSMRNQQAGMIDPSRGGFRAAVEDPERAKMVADAAGKAAGLGDRQKVAGLQAAVSIGSGQATDTQAAFDDLAGSALQENISRQETAFNRQAARTNAIMTGVGALGGAAKNANWGGTAPPPKPDIYSGNFAVPNR